MSAGARPSSRARVCSATAAACAALTIGMSPICAKEVPPELILDDIGQTALVEQGLKDAGLEGDLKMIRLWARLKTGEIQVEGQKAASKVSEQQVLAAARMRVRSLQPYLDEAQRDIFANKWKYVQGYTGVVFSQRDAIQTLITDNYPGEDPVSLASKDALVNEGNNVLKSAEALAAAAKKKSQADALQAYARLALSYDRLLKAGDLPQFRKQGRPQNMRLMSRSREISMGRCSMSFCQNI